MVRRSLLVVGWGALALWGCANDNPVAPEQARVPAASQNPARPSHVPGQYIVVLKDGAPNPRILSGQMAAAHKLTVRHTFQHTIRGFSAVIPEAALPALRNHPWVRSIEPNGIAYLDYVAAPDPVPTAGLRVRLVADDLGSSLADGGAVASWPNLGTTGAAAQGSATKRPTYHAGAGGPFSGHAHVGFNEGSDNDEVLEITGIAAHGSATLIAVFKQDDASTHNYGIFGLYGSTANRGGFVTRHNKSGADPLSYWDVTNGWKDSNYTVATGTAHVAVWRMDANVAADYQVDGTARGSAALASGLHTPFSRYVVGATEPVTKSRFDGQIAELLLYDRALGDCERNDVVATLGARYGISVAVTGGACAPPADPTALIATPFDAHRIDLSWADNASNESGYRIERRQGQAGAFAEVATVGAGVSAHADGGLASETEYCYRVAAFNANGDSAFSEIVCAATAAVSPPPPADPVPTGGLRVRLVADDLGGSLTDGASVPSWPNLGSASAAQQASASKQPAYNAGSGPLFGGHAHVGFNEGADNDEVLEIMGVAAHGSATLIAVFSQDDANAHTYGIFGLWASSADRGGFVTRHEGGADPLSYWDRTHGWKDGTFTAAAGTAYVAVWRVKEGVATDYQVDGAAWGSALMAGPIHAPFSRYVIGASEPVTTSRFDGQIAELLLYDRALADCERDDIVAKLGARYGISVAVAGGACQPPADPSALTATAIDYARIDLAWTDNANNEAGYRIERRQGQAGAFVEIGTVGPGVTSYADNSAQLIPESQYCYRVVAFNGDGDSGSSNTDCATTLAAPPGVCANTGGHDDLAQLWNITRVKADRNATWLATLGSGCEIVPWFFGLDSGVDADHPDLNVIEIRSFVAAEPSATGEDGNGHGTHTAGSAAARDGNGGVVGVAPGAKIYGFRVCKDDGSCTHDDIIAAVDEVTARKLANPGQPIVANLSLGGPPEGDALEIAIRRSVNAGVVYSISAGNGIDGACFFAGNSQNVSPARAGDDDINTASGSNGDTRRINGVLTTTSSNANDQSVGCNYGNPVTIAAPGVNVKSTWLAGGYNTISGTSMAAPHAAGAALLYLQDHPAATPTQVEQAIKDLLDSWSGSPTPNADGRLDVEDL